MSTLALNYSSNSILSQNHLVSFCSKKRKPKKNVLTNTTNTELQSNLSKENLKILDEIRQVAKKQGKEVYLFGGGVRDCVLGKKVKDLDIMVNGDALDFSQSLTQENSNLFIGNRLKKKVKRAVVYTKNVDIDIVPMDYEKEIPHDKDSIRSALIRKAKSADYSINSLLIKLGEDKNGKLKFKLIDIFEGKKDIKNNVLRVLNQDEFSTSPIVAIRGIRFKNRYGMKTEPQIHDLIKTTISKPPKGSNPLRVAKEFYKLFKEAKNPVEFLKLMYKYNPFKFIKP